MSFQPSQYSTYGDAAPADDLFSKAQALLTQAAPALSLAQQLIGKTDLEKLEILRAKVANYKKMRTVMPYSSVPGKAWYDNEIRKMQGMIKALEVETAQAQSTTTDWSILRKVTIAGAVVSVIVVGTLGYAVVTRANAT